jgi:hypothetical protein
MKGKNESVMVAGRDISNRSFQRESRKRDFAGAVQVFFKPVECNDKKKGPSSDGHLFSVIDRFVLQIPVRG